MAPTQNRVPVPEEIATRLRTETPDVAAAIASDGDFDLPGVTDVSEEMNARLAMLGEAGLLYAARGMPCTISPPMLRDASAEIALVHGYTRQGSAWARGEGPERETDPLETYGKNTVLDVLKLDTRSTSKTHFWALIAHAFQMPIAAFLSPYREAFVSAMYAAMAGKDIFAQGLAYFDAARSVAPVLRVLHEGELAFFMENKAKRGVAFHDATALTVGIELDQRIFTGAHLPADFQGDCDVIAFYSDAAGRRGLLSQPELMEDVLAQRGTAIVPRGTVITRGERGVSFNELGAHRVFVIASSASLERFPTWQRARTTSFGTEARHHATQLTEADFVWLRNHHLREGPDRVKVLVRDIVVVERDADVASLF